MKNLCRTVIVGITIVVAIGLGENLDKFLSMLGAAVCSHIAFTLPLIFHLKVAKISKC